MRFVSVVVAAYLPYQGISMNDPQGFLAHLREEANNGNGEALHDLGQIMRRPN